MSVLLMGLAAIFAPPADCAGLATALDSPVAITTRPLSGEELGGTLMDPVRNFDPVTYMVGRLRYLGSGIAIRSADPRFRDIVVDQAFGLHHRCGNPVTGPSGWNAHHAKRDGQVIRFEPMRSLPVAAPGASEQGGTPVLQGHRIGATWPIMVDHRRIFIGLMHPVDGQARTLLVAFPERVGPAPALVLARLPLSLQTVHALPDLHYPRTFIDLHGRAPDGTLLDLILEADHDTLSGIAREVG
jgi:hypothetical protein